MGALTARLLVVNAGSSSLKLAVLGGDDATLAERTVEWPAGAAFPDAALDDLPRPDVVAHRVVHGGERLQAATWIDAVVRAEIAALTELAPLHQPRAVAAIDALAARLPDTRAAACFDTAFHATLPAAAATYALPPEWPRRRYGFHGLSHAYASRRAAELTGHDPATFRVVTCHLGAGASLAAVSGGRSVDTTMGFTPLDGLVMASRPGALDPGLVLWLLEHRGLSAAALGDALEHRAGLTGLAGTGDMRELLPRADAGDPDARLALDVYVHRLRAGIAAMAAAMDGLDALVFTGGVGEHAPAIRAAAVQGLGFLGPAMDGDRVLVMTAREDLEMARQVRALVSDRATGTGGAA